MTDRAGERIVVDASAVVALVAYSDKGREWAEREVASRVLFAPELMPFEVSNALRSRLMAHRLDATTADAALRRLDTLPVSLVPFKRIAKRAWELRANLTVYDASYAALAELLGAPLVTLDGRMAGAPGLRCEVRVFGF